MADVRKTRADALLVERGLAPSRAKAQALILAGKVHANGQRLDKAGTLVAAEAELSVSAPEPFVSRGGRKLDGALSALALDVSGRICVDVGASTGGFTDCLLQRGARKVYAVDVGHGQLARSLAGDERVVVMDRTNARYLRREDFPDPIELAVVDASFISLSKLLPALSTILTEGGLLLALVKPQFEAGQDEARRSRGVITDPEVRTRAIDAARAAVVAQGFAVLGECDSTLAGPKGNLEHFVLSRRGA